MTFSSSRHKGSKPNITKKQKYNCKTKKRRIRQKKLKRNHHQRHKKGGGFFDSITKTIKNPFKTSQIHPDTKPEAQAQTQTQNTKDKKEEPKNSNIFKTMSSFFSNSSNSSGSNNKIVPDNDNKVKPNEETNKYNNGTTPQIKSSFNMGSAESTKTKNGSLFNYPLLNLHDWYSNDSVGSAKSGASNGGKQSYKKRHFHRLSSKKGKLLK